MFITKQGLTSSPSSVPTKKIAPTISVGGVVYGWSDALGRYVAQMQRVPHIPRRGKIGVLGSSITANGVTVVGGVDAVTPKSVLAWLNGNRYQTKILGYSGQTTDVIRSHLTEMLAWGPDILVLEYGMNNVTNAAQAETDLAKLQVDCETCIAAGVVPVVQVMHVSSSNGNIVGASAYNIIAQEWCLYRGIPCISALWAIADKTSSNCIATANSLPDGLHPGSLGARLIGEELSRVLDGIIDWRILPCGSAQTVYETFVNPKMTGATTASDTGFSGTKPTTWVLGRTGSATGVCSVGSDAEGSYFDIACTFSAAAEVIDIGETAATNFAKWLPGKTYRGYADIEVISGSAIRGITMLFFAAGGSFVYPNGNAPNFTTGTTQTGRWELRSHPIPTSSLGASWSTNPGIRINADAAGTATVRIRGISARESRW
ncbi:MAG: SGNH/GDSL hydrolase family protein [Flavobacteriales bacterium]|nr:SGNH/GDSL hydrolase family protein [Flavobacteriales bacterium]